MPRIDEIAYRSRQLTLRRCELSTPALNERFLVQQHATGKPALVAFWVVLNTFQHLRSQKGYLLTPCCYPEEEDV